MQVQDLFAGHHPVLFLAASSLDLASLLRAIFICLLLYKKTREAELFARVTQPGGKRVFVTQWAGPTGGCVDLPMASRVRSIYESPLGRGRELGLVTLREEGCLVRGPLEAKLSALIGVWLRSFVPSLDEIK